MLCSRHEIAVLRTQLSPVVQVLKKNFHTDTDSSVTLKYGSTHPYLDRLGLAGLHKSFG